MRHILEGEEMSLIKRMELEALKYSGVVSLAQGVPWYDMPENVMEFVLEKISKGQTNRYSVVRGIPELREQIALRYYNKNGVELDYKNEICITTGAIQAISSVLLSFLNEYDDVVLIDPCYASYKGCVQITKANPVYVSLNSNLDLDLESLKSAIGPNTKAIVIANPNNPTGSIFSLSKIKKILEYIKGDDIMLIMDEVYDEFLYDGNEFESAIDLYEQYKDNLIIVNSWSKTFGMTGWRVGYFICNPQLMEQIDKVHDSLVTCAPVHSQWAALSTFEIFDEWTLDVRKQLQKRRDYTLDVLDDLKQYIKFHVPDAAYFFYPKFKYTEDDYNECLKIVKDARVAVVPGSGFGDYGKGHFRICFGRDFDDLREGLDRLREYFKGN